MNQKKVLYHEGHRDHEDFSCNRMILHCHQPGWNNQLLFFAAFVFFVVNIWDIG